MNARSRPEACSATWDGTPEPVWGTAAVARFWVGLEQPGPWGHKALVQSRLDPRLGRELERACHEADGRALLIRGVDASRDHDLPRRRVFVSGGMPRGEPWLLTGSVAAPADLLDLPWPDLATGDKAAALAAVPALTESPDPVLFVCTNSKRDVCCAVRGLPVARQLAKARPGAVWECTHTGGHRFAPTGVLLPHGLTLGRLEVTLSLAALDAAAADRIAPAVNDPAHHRGLSHLPPPLQAADAYIRHRERIEDLTDLVTARLPGGQALVTARDGRRWRLRVRSTDLGTWRRNSCTLDAIRATAWSVTPVQEAATGA